MNGWERTLLGSEIPAAEWVQRSHIDCSIQALRDLRQRAGEHQDPPARKARPQFNATMTNVFSLGVKAHFLKMPFRPKSRPVKRRPMPIMTNANPKNSIVTNSRSDYSFLARPPFGSTPILQIPRARSHALRSEGLRLFDALAQFKKPTIFGLKPVQIDDLRVGMRKFVAA
jgi:hypothetical protein